MSPSWWPAPSIRRVFGRFWATERRQGRRVLLVGISASPGRPQSQRHSAGHFRCLPRFGREHHTVSTRGAVIAELRAGEMGKATDIVEQAVRETLSYYAFPTSIGTRSVPTTHWSGS
jgi:hypothetical protein